MAGFRVFLDLEQFYSDVRKKSYCYIDLAQDEEIHDVKNKIRAHFNISCDVTLVVNGYFIPGNENVRVLRENDVIKVFKLPNINLNSTAAESDLITDTSMPETKNAKSGKSKEKKKSEQLHDFSIHNMLNSVSRKRKNECFEETELLSKNETHMLPQEEDNSGLYEKQHSNRKKKKRKTKEIPQNLDNFGTDKHNEMNSSIVCEKVTTQIEQNEKNSSLDYDFRDIENTQSHQKTVTETPVHIDTHNDSKGKERNLNKDSKPVYQPNESCLENEKGDTGEKNFMESSFSNCSGKDQSQLEVSGASTEKSKKGHKRCRRSRKKKILVSSVAKYVTEFEQVSPAAQREVKQATHVKFTSDSDECDSNTCKDKLEKGDTAQTSTPGYFKPWNMYPQNSDNAVNRPLPKPANSHSGPLIFECKKSSMHSESASPVTKESHTDYSQHPELNGTPKRDDVIAFKILKLGEDYTPNVSQYITGRVLSISEDKRIKLLILHGANELKEPDGKFSIGYEDNSAKKEETKKEEEFNIDELLEVRTIYP